MESEAFPPDICYSGEASSPSSHAWGKTLNESQETENESDADNAEDPLLCESGELNECENTAEGAAVEGAVGGKLPDLCNTVSRSLSPLMYKKLDENIADTLSHSHNCNSFACGESCSQNCDTIPVVDSTALVDSVDNENPNFSCGLVTDQIDEFKEESLDNESQNQTEKCVCSLYGNINFLPCETGDIEKRLKNILGAKYSLNRSCPESQFSVCCDISGALQEEIKEEEKQESPSVCGLEFVRENILHSSDPLFHDWKCCALIPSYLLMPVSLHSHGTSVGYVGVYMYILFYSLKISLFQFPSRREEERQLGISLLYYFIIK